MSKIKFGCETYTWQMPGEQYKGKLEHIMNICTQTGFAGIEPETSFLQHLSDPVLMKEALDKYNLELAVLCVVEDWLQPMETDEEKERADYWINFLADFPDTILLLVQMPGSDRENLKERQQNLLSCINGIARRATDQGIVCSYYPNSPEGSNCRIKSDYDFILNGLDTDVIGYCPDVGHIAKGDMDPMSIMKEYRSMINLVHYKDIYDDGSWAPTGLGRLDFVGYTQYLKDTGFEGWIIMEDECDQAITDPDGVTFDDGKYIKTHLEPLV